MSADQKNEIMKRIERKIDHIAGILIGGFSSFIFVYALTQADKVGGFWGTVAPWILPVVWLFGTAYLISLYRKCD
jgi:hypothetical protein